jgi:heme a synthase
MRQPANPSIVQLTSVIKGTRNREHTMTQFNKKTKKYVAPVTYSQGPRSQAPRSQASRSQGPRSQGPSHSQWSRWLPNHIDRRVRVFAWLSLIFQCVIVGTGGLVRLTQSGLGCPTWPTCTPESLVATPEMGMHGVIEFGNRLLSLVLAAVAIGMFILVLRLRTRRRDLFVLSLLLVLGVPAQALIGGASVLTGLNPYVVGLHFVVSVVLIALATTLVFRVIIVTNRVAGSVPAWMRAVGHLASACVAVTIVLGIITTGSGPHAGGPDAPRNGLSSPVLEGIHTWSAYTLVVLTFTLLILCFTVHAPALRRWVWVLMALEVTQITVGVIQARTGLPAALVNTHMILAVLLVATMTTVLLSMKYPTGVRAS